MPDVVDQRLHVILNVHGESAYGEQVVGVGWEEGGNTESDCRGGPDTSVQELVLL